MEKTESINIGLVGAGGVGGYFGGRMALGGLGVTLIARGAHARALKQGLTLVDNGRSHVLHPAVLDTGVPGDLEQLEQLDWLIFTCKAFQTRALCEQLGPHIASRTHLLSLQNGVDGAATLHTLLQRPAAEGMSIRFGAHVARPGEVQVVGHGYLMLGAVHDALTAPVSKLVQVLRHAEVDARFSDNIRRELWRKLIINNSVNPVTALVEQDTGYVLKDPGLVAVVDRLMEETVRAARADGVVLTEADHQQLRSVIFNLDPIKTSMQVDREKGRTMELDAICGAVIERSQRLGTRAADTETLYALLKAIGDTADTADTAGQPKR